MDQGPLNQIIECQDDEIICKSRLERVVWGLMNHCFSAMDERIKGTKRKCMRALKLAAAK